MNNESKERDFYLQHSQRTQNPLGKLMFASIATDEDEHYNRILDLHEKLISDKKWPENVPIKVKGTEVKAVIQQDGGRRSKPRPKRIRTIWRPSKSPSILKPKGRCFYSNLAREVENPMEKKFYEFLAGIEREHRLSLEDTYEFFKDPADWYRVKEKLHVDGA